MKIKNTIKLLVLLPLLAACSDVFGPAIENNRTEDLMTTDPAYAHGLLGYGYAMLPYDSKSVSDVATDDAVSNYNSNNYLQMALGSWAANSNPMEQWSARKAAIQYLNTFFGVVDDVVWSSEPSIQTMFCDKYKGEAYALRALNYFYLLIAHGGKSRSGELLGVPILTEPENATGDFNLPRDSFEDCLRQIYSDLDAAEELLPLDFVDVTDAGVPQKYQAIGVTNAGYYNRVFGTYMRGRITRRIIEAIRAQVALLAASPAFEAGSWEDAANYAAAVLNRIGGVSGLDAKGNSWYNNHAEIDALGGGASPAEILWRGDRTNGTEDWDLGLNQEADNFPPTLYGKGRINPSQNLVDAFPMANGYPISNPSSGYDAQNPYAGRDPRLSLYVLYNGQTYGINNKEIITGTYGTNNDALNKEATSTRTGYYLRKLLRDDCNPDPSAQNAQYHYPVRIRYTEIFLDYAEAANEAWGPSSEGPHGFSAYDVIKAIRQRGGIVGDLYLESIKNDQAGMRELIRNERRIELCFENKRFWDLRRWKAPLGEAAKGMKIEKAADGSLKYTVIEVEKRSYQDYMYYGPIPQSEILKYSNLEQNAGW